MTDIIPVNHLSLKIYILYLSLEFLNLKLNALPVNLTPDKQTDIIEII